MKYLLLDIDGVLIQANPWQTVKLLNDGFYEFNNINQKCFANIMQTINPTIILITSHKNNYTIQQWKNIFQYRNIPIQNIYNIDEINNEQLPKINAITQWYNNITNNNQNNQNNIKFAIIDDDNQLQNLPTNIKKQWIKTNPNIGLNKEITQTIIDKLID